MSRAIIIGAGFGGLALGIRLQSAGVETVIVEARDKPGGRAYFRERDGFTFDAGPTVITDPDCLRDLWALSGRDMADDVTLLPVDPFYRLSWIDGTSFDYSNDDAALTSEIAKLDPGDVAGYRKFLDYSKGVYEEGYQKLGHEAVDARAMLRAAPSLAKHQAWRSVYSVVARYVRNEKLRQALSFHTLLIGGNPFTTSAIYALIHKLERDGGVWFGDLTKTGVFETALLEGQDVPFVDPYDIGAFGAAALTSPEKFAGQSVEIITEYLTPDDAIGLLGGAVGKNLSVKYLSEAEVEERAKVEVFLQAQYVVRGQVGLASAEQVRSWGVPVGSFKSFLEREQDVLKETFAGVPHAN